MANGKKLRKFWVENALTIATIGGVMVGVIVGVILNNSADENNAYTPRHVMYVAYVGKLFLQMLKCIIIPLIIPSLIFSVGSLDLSLSRKVGCRAILYYMATTVLAVVLGMILVVAIGPGRANDDKHPSEDMADGNRGRNVTTADTLMDLVRNCFPPNIVGATVHQYRTVLDYPGPGKHKREGYVVDEADKTTWDFHGDKSDTTNILGLVVFSVVIGVAIASVGEAGRPLLAFFESLSTVMMKVTQWIIYLAPVGVLFLVAGQIMAMRDMAGTFQKLGLYFVTVLLGLLIHGCVVLPLVFGLVTRRLPFSYVANIMNALTTAFGTASSSATLPITIECIERGNGVDPRISRFVLPIGATINMDGTALYEAVAAIFIAQVRNVSLGIGQVIGISVTATAASIGAAGIPQAGLVTMVMVLDTVGLPAEDVALILAVDWLLDRFRTAINVLGDALGAGIVHHLSQKELAKLSQADAANHRQAEDGNMNEFKSSGVHNSAYETSNM